MRTWLLISFVVFVVVGLFACSYLDQSRRKRLKEMAQSGEGAFVNGEKVEQTTNFLSIADRCPTILYVAREIFKDEESYKFNDVPQKQFVVDFVAPVDTMRVRDYREKRIPRVHIDIYVVDDAGVVTPDQCEADLIRLPGVDADGKVLYAVEATVDLEQFKNVDKVVIPNPLEPG